MTRSVVLRESGQAIKLLVGLLLGFFLAFPVMFVLAFPVVLVAQATLAVASPVWDSAPASDATIQSLSFVAGWALSTFIIVRGMPGISRVFSRACLLGGTSCVALAVIFPIGVLTEPSYDGIVPREFFAFFLAGMSLAAAGACFVGFKVSKYIDRKMHPESEAPSLRSG